MSSPFAGFLAAVLCVFAFVTIVFVNISNNIDSPEASDEIPTIPQKLFGNEKVIMSVAGKLEISSEDVIFKLDRKGEPYYVTSAGTFYAEFKDDGNGDLEVDYLMEVLK